MKTEEKKEVTSKASKFQFTIDEIREMAENSELIEIINDLSKDDYNKGQSGLALLRIARGVIKQTKLKIE